MNYPKPIIEKIEFSKEDQADINALLEGRPTKAGIENQEKKGIDVQHWINYHRPISEGMRKNILKKKYYRGLCFQCGALPYWKLTFKIKDASIIQRYCSSCLPKEFF